MCPGHTGELTMKPRALDNRVVTESDSVAPDRATNRESVELQNCEKHGSPHLIGLVALYTQQERGISHSPSRPTKERTAGRWLSVSQEERSQRDPTLPAPRSWASAARTVRKHVSGVEASQSVGFVRAT